MTKILIRIKKRNLALQLKYGLITQAEYEGNLQRFKNKLNNNIIGRL